MDLDDVRVLDLGEEPPLGERGGHRVVVAGVEQALEHDPAVGDVAVLGEVDPAHAAVGEAADDLVLAGDDVAGGELRREREVRAAARGRSPRSDPARRRARARPGSSQRAQNRRDSATARVSEHGGGGVAERRRRDLDEPGAQTARGRAGATSGRAPDGRTVGGRGLRGDRDRDCARRRGAIPQMSQYPSRTLPSQSGCSQFIAARPGSRERAAPRRAGRSGAA